MVTENTTGRQKNEEGEKLKARRYVRRQLLFWVPYGVLILGLIIHAKRVTRGTHHDFWSTTSGIVATLLFAMPMGILFLMAAFSVLYIIYFSLRIAWLRRRGKLQRALRLARLWLWLERGDRRFGQLFGSFMHGDPNQHELECLQRSGRGTVPLVCELLRETGQYDEAEQLIEEEMKFARAIGGEATNGHGVLLFTLAGVHLHRGAVAAARPLLEQALAIQRNALQNRPPRPPQKSALAEKISQTLEREIDPSPLQIGVTLAHLGMVYQALGDYPAAVRSYEEALAVYSGHKRATREQTGGVLVNLGGLYLEMGDLDRAGDRMRQTVEYMRSNFGVRYHGYAVALLNLAMWHEKKRQYPRAIKLLRECVRIRARMYGTKHREYLHALNNLANTLRQSGKLDAARPLAEQVLSGRQVFGEDHPLSVLALGSQAMIDVIDGRPGDALIRFREAFAIDQRIMGRLFSIASDAQRLSYLDKVRERFQLFLSLVHGHLTTDPLAVAQAYDWVLARKALAAEATAARRDAVLGGRYPHLAGQLHGLSALRQQIAAQTLAGPGNAAHDRMLAEWRQRQEQLEVELARLIPEVALQQRLLAADHRAVAAALPAGTALVEFVRFDLFDFRAVPARGDEKWKPARYLAFVVRAAAPDTVRMIDLGEAMELERLVRQFRDSLLGGEGGSARGMVLIDDRPVDAAPALPGAALRERVFDPAQEAVAGVDHLILAPDGELVALPFEVLPGSAGAPLLEEYRFSYLAVGRDILRTEIGYGESSKALVIAGPDFDFEHGTDLPSALGKEDGSSIRPTSEPPVLSRDLDRSSLLFAPLPGTVAEGREVAALLKVEPLLGRAAVESCVKQSTSPRVLHIATHGFFLPDRQTDPEGGSRGASPENPLLRSGLAFAGANTWLRGGAVPAEAEDGLLTAEDVMGLDLRGTELVVLSACETGLGQVRAGEGVFGLRRAFQLAGARSVVMSLWKVADEPTRELMATFYRHLLTGLPRAEALRRSQRDLRTRYPQPRVWGAFILQGDPTPLPSVMEKDH
jgi:CHAT domain-containing protein/tetratricopeptide (TPR) repeat protein